MADQSLIDALKLGEAACLVMMALEPISSTVSKWEAAAKLIKKERNKLEMVPAA